MTNKKKVSPETIARTIILVIALVNTVLTMSGKNPLPFADDDIYTAVSIIATLIGVIRLKRCITPVFQNI